MVIRRLLSHSAACLTVLDDIWLPGAAFRGLTLELLTANKAPDVWPVPESEFGVSMVRADEKLRAVAAAPDSRRAARACPPATPLLQVDRIVLHLRRPADGSAPGFVPARIITTTAIV